MQDNLTQVHSRAAWRGETIDYRSEGLRLFTPDEVAELEAGLAIFRTGSDIDLAAMSPANFPLPHLGPRLAAMRAQLRTGPGFLLLRGLPRERLSDDDLALIYFAICLHIGRPHAQSHLGELLGHVLDITDLEPAQRGYHKGGSQPFHSDACDVVGLICLRRAKTGGASRLASMVEVHNTLVREQPEAATRLYRGYPHRRTELDAKFGNGIISPPYPLSVFSRDSGELSCFFRGGSVAMYRRTGEVLLDDSAFAAIDAVDRIAGSEGSFLDMDFHEGDIQFLNNRTLIHSRTDYEDHPEFARRRHLLRVWIAMPDWPAMPVNQTIHTEEDHRLWQRQRQPFMEQPSVYLARLASGHGA